MHVYSRGTLWTCRIINIYIFFLHFLDTVSLYNMCVRVFHRREKNLWRGTQRKNTLEGSWRQLWGCIYLWMRRPCWTGQWGSGVWLYFHLYCGLVTTRKCCPDKIKEKHSCSVINCLHLFYITLISNMKKKYISIPKVVIAFENRFGIILKRLNDLFLILKNEVFFSHLPSLAFILAYNLKTFL